MWIDCLLLHSLTDRFSSVCLRKAQISLSYFDCTGDKCQIFAAKTFYRWPGWCSSFFKKRFCMVPLNVQKGTFKITTTKGRMLTLKLPTRFYVFAHFQSLSLTERSELNPTWFAPSPPFDRCYLQDKSTGCPCVFKWEASGLSEVCDNYSTCTIICPSVQSVIPENNPSFCDDTFAAVHASHKSVTCLLMHQSSFEVYLECSSDSRAKQLLNIWKHWLEGKFKWWIWPNQVELKSHLAMRFGSEIG